MPRVATPAAPELTSLHHLSPASDTGLFEDLSSHGDGRARGRPTRVEGKMCDDLRQFVSRQAILQRELQVEGQLICSIGGDQSRHGHSCARRGVRPGRFQTSPNKTLSVYSASAGATSANGLRGAFDFSVIIVDPTSFPDKCVAEQRS